jgi:hypothetical protein
MNTIATLSTAIAAAAKEYKYPNNDGSGGGGSGGGGGGRDCNHGGGNRDDKAFRYRHNMGGYCSTHGHYSVSINHTSATCTQKRDNHNNSTTATNPMGGCMF